MRISFLARPLSRLEKAGLLALFLAFAGFGALVLQRSAFLKRRMGDTGVYLRAGWAVKAGGHDLYRVTCDNRWHYCYPPTYAVLMVPLADPPDRDAGLAAATTAGLVGGPGGAGPLLAATALAASPLPFQPGPPGGLPYPVSIAVCYAFNLLCLALAVHLLAGALSESSPSPGLRRLSAGSRGWWAMRILPVLVCLPPIGHTLMRGQTNLLLLLFVCGMVACMLRQQPARAGAWLAGAICLKIFPAYLLLVPLLRRDGRCLAGCALGLVVGLGLVPLAAMGPRQTVACYQDLAEVLIAPALNLGGDSSRAKELLEVNATDNVSFQSALHNNLYPIQALRPRVASPAVRNAHLLLGAALTLLTLLVGRRAWRGTGPELALMIGALVLVMLPCSPVCHSHYFALSVVMVMALLAVAWERDAITPLSWALVGVFALQGAGNALTHLPALERFKDAGAALGLALTLWATGCVVMLRRRPLPAAQAEAAPALSRAA